ncbi:DEN5B protein, partial [Acromyrmex insinuator]
MNGSLGITRGPEQHPQRFADYFVICGLDKDSGLEPDKYFGDSLQCTPLDRAYKSKVLGHYPDSVPWNPFDEHAVCMLCLPSGLRFRTQKHSVEPTFHSFVLTKEDGHRTYGFSLVFYEECRNRKICSAMQTLQAMHITELSSGQNGTPPTARKGQDGHNTRSLPRHFKLSAHSPGAALGYYDSTKDKLLVTKSISLLCQQPYLHATKTFLTNLYKCVPRHPGPGLSLESYVYNLLYNVPVPLPGKSLKFFVPNDEPAKSPLELVIHQPSPSLELPMLDYPLKDVFTWLGADCLIQLFTCVLLENQVLLRSADFHKLMVVSECITALLFPFSWQHVYVPILPASLHHFLDAPVPFIMGLHAHNEGGVLKIASEANLCYVDIDKQSSQFPEELPVFPHKMQFINEIRALLNKYKIPHSGKTDNMIINYYNGDIMTSSLTLPGSGFHLPRRKHSLHDVLDWDRPEPGPQSDNLQRTVDIIKRVNMDDIDPIEDTTEKILTPQEEYQETLIFNNTIREIFLNRFVQMFSSYEHFVIQPSQDKDEWINNRDSMHVFDKATFLSDQPTQHLPFLSRFLETQMFASLVDSKVMSTWSELDCNIKVFDQRISALKKKVGESIIRSMRYESCTSIADTQQILEQRLINIDFETNPPAEILPHRAAYFRSFPLLDNVALNKEPAQSSRRGQTQWKYKMKSMDTNGKPAIPQESQSPRPQTKLSADMSPALIAQANWTFVEKLLKDCKSKTKRMLVEKMGSEAVALGHGGESLSDVEENTLVASLCDLLERVWSHGLQNKQGKSALWSHLTMYQESEECNDATKSIDSNFLSPALAWSVLRKRLDSKKSPNKFFGIPERLVSSLRGKSIIEIASYIKDNFNDLSNLQLETDVSPTRGTDKHKSSSERKTIGPEHLRPLPDSLIFDIRNVQAMTDIKTHIGYARAWVRLALEKKLLSRHLKILLSDNALLRTQYKRSAFLRCEEEKEQFLYHLLTLNAVDYFCFTNNYPTTKLPYRVVIFPSRKASAATTSANSWIAISGTLCETNPVPIPKGALEFVFHHKNLGVLSTLRIGHDNTGLSPKWMVEHVVVRNEVTGHTFKFPCGRWLGRGIDDGSTERLLVGALVPRSIDSEELVESCSTPPRCRSPSIPRRPIFSQVELQHMLGEAVNAIVKYHYRRECQDGSLTALLCGEGGLVPSLEQIFLFGFKNQRIFGRNFYVWDYLSAREQLLHPMLRPMSDARSTMDMYEENSFLRNPTLLTFLIHILEPLSEFHIVLEKSLTHGISSIC